MPKEYDQNFLKELGRRIAALRKNAGISQEELAARVDVHRTYIGFVEQGKRNPTANTLHRIAAVLGLPIQGLFESGDMTGLVMEEPPKKK